MLENIGRAIIGLLISGIIFLNVWFIGSYMEVVLKNLDGTPLSFWNIFQIAIN